MVATDLYIAASFWTGHRNEITAVATVVAAVLLAQLVDRALSRRTAKLAATVTGRELSATADGLPTNAFPDASTIATSAASAPKASRMSFVFAERTFGSRDCTAFWKSKPPATAWCGR